MLLTFLHAENGQGRKNEYSAIQGRNKIFVCLYLVLFHFLTEFNVKRKKFIYSYPKCIAQ